MRSYAEFGPLAGHLRFAGRASRKLAREVFHGMLRHGPKLQNKQAFLFRLVDVGNELFAMTASVARAQALRGTDQDKDAVQLAVAALQKNLPVQISGATEATHSL